MTMPKKNILMDRGIVLTNKREKNKENITKKMVVPKPILNKAILSFTKKH